MKYQYPFSNKISKESFISVISRIINALFFYLITAIVSKNFSKDQFAIWTVFVTSVNLLPLLNFGFTTGLVNRLSYNNSITVSNKLVENSKLISAIFFIQFIIAVSLIALYLLIIQLFPQLIDLQQKYNIHNIKYIVIVLIVSIPFQVYSSILFAHNKINESNFMSVCQNIFLFITTYSLTSSKELFSELVLNYSMVYSLSLVLFFIYSIRVNYIKLVFLKLLEIYIYTKLIIKPSVLFWLMSLVSNVLSNAQIFFVTFFFGLQSIPEFFLFQRLFSILNTFQLAYLSPYTVRFIACASTDEWNKIKNLVWSLFFKLTLPLYLIFGVGFIIFHPLIINYWTNLNIINYSACILFFISFFLTSISNIFSVLLNSLGHFTIQIVLSLIAFILFFIFLYLSINILGSYSIIFSVIPSAIVTVIVMIRYSNGIIKQKLHFV
jgi:O-antigen/teichoic acid export membrane protein